MAEDAITPAAGGFLPQTLPSPAPTTSTVSTRPIGLPHPRSRALRPGSSKEDQVRKFVSNRMAHITRRFVKKVGAASLGEKIDGQMMDDEEVEGYNSLDELCKDLDEVIRIVWLSGTPNLQIPSLLNIASEFNTWMTGFPPSDTAAFEILHKLDHCFASLLSGEDIETHEPLPGFENGLRGGMTRTDMVRCKSTVQNARVVIVDVMSKRRPGNVQEVSTEETEESGTDGPAGFSGSAWDDDQESLYMDVARVYENTLVKLGETLGESGVADTQMSAD
ncbi:hypothetical protein C7999DRAFT_34904 [Corynascus novoguineensis]|uniref:Meiotic recombination protein DMC1 n=1 Tax=Corynascus novoguineensis TaxID=1126955 RepID=A0AAN7CMC8_9PEZI|nr:hypothetical protein C7999DRAFT_34904 [Corynascus novoguineensis]